MMSYNSLSLIQLPQPIMAINDRFAPREAIVNHIREYLASDSSAPITEDREFAREGPQ